MSFLDNLENSLKAMESREERDPEKIQRDRASREVARIQALLIAPHALALRNGPFTSQLMSACRRIGHEMRTLVRFTWLDSTLRLEAKLAGKDHKLELRPAPEGVRVIWLEGGREQQNEWVDLSGDAESLARRWLGRGEDQAAKADQA